MRTKGWSVYVTFGAGTGGVSGASRCRPARLLLEAEMLVGDLARPKGGGRWATFVAPHAGLMLANGGR